MGIGRVVEREVQDELIAVVDDLEGSPEVAVREIPGEAGLELTARRTGKPGITRAPVTNSAVSNQWVPMSATARETPPAAGSSRQL